MCEINNEYDWLNESFENFEDLTGIDLRGLELTLGEAIPVFLEVRGKDMADCVFEISGNNEIWAGDINYSLYHSFLVDLIEKRNKTIGDMALLENKSDEDCYIVSFSVTTNCRSAIEAVEKSISIIDEMIEPLDRVMDKVKGFIERELNLN